jgi:hypothetical protein
MTDEKSIGTLDKWAERVYTETDFGRSVATSVAGVIGLVVYLFFDDWVIAAFSAIIAFPVVRLIATGLHTRSTGRYPERIYGQLSDGEKEVVQGFVDAGGCVLTWGQVNKMPMRSASIETLIERKLLWTSVTADGITETFVLDTTLFDVGQARKGK